jgi:hypothetical protein
MGSGNCPFREGQSTAIFKIGCRGIGSNLLLQA